MSYFISKNPACSSLLERSYIVYSNTAKQDLLNISSYALQKYGAVSKEIAIAMAEGALDNSRASISIAITGVEAPDDKNTKITKGSVWIGCAGIDKKTMTEQLKPIGNRRKFLGNVILNTFKILLNYLKNN